MQERQKLIQNYQKETSKADKDIKFAHQQFKHNRANCERQIIRAVNDHKNSITFKEGFKFAEIESPTNVMVQK